MLDIQLAFRKTETECHCVGQARLSCYVVQLALSSGFPLSLLSVVTAGTRHHTDSRKCLLNKEIIRFLTKYRRFLDILNNSIKEIRQWIREITLSAPMCLDMKIKSHRREKVAQGRRARARK